MTLSDSILSAQEAVWRKALRVPELKAVARAAAAFAQAREEDRDAEDAYLTLLDALDDLDLLDGDEPPWEWGGEG